MSADFSLRPRITVVGVGGAGCNAVNNMIRAQLEGVDFLVANTDAQSLDQSLVESNNRIQLGPSITKGLGAGSKPDVGRGAAEESVDEVLGRLKDSNMVFITAGMGGGTGTGAAPVIARIAKEAGILTVGVITKPFFFEGAHRSLSAEKGIIELQKYVDTLIIIPNQNLFRVANEQTTFADAFKMADEVLYSGVRGVTDLMIMPGLINLDFADVKAVMAEMGNAMMGTGEAEGERRALDAAEAAIANPLLDDVSMKGAHGVLINITGGYDLTLFEVDEAVNRVREDVENNANIIFGSTFDERLNGKIRVSVVATGIKKPEVDEESGLESKEVQAEQLGLGNMIRKTFGGGAQSFSAHNSLYANGAAESFSTEHQEINAFVSEGEPELPKEQKNLVLDDFEKTEEIVATVRTAPETPQSGFNSQERYVDSQKRKEGVPKKSKISFLGRITGTRRGNNNQGVQYEVGSLEGRNKKNEQEEDLSSLEIPAFLRREGSKR